MSVIMNVLNTVRKENSAVEDEAKPEVNPPRPEAYKPQFTKPASPDASSLSLDVARERTQEPVRPVEIEKKRASFRESKEYFALRQILFKLKSKTGFSMLMYAVAIGFISFSVFYLWKACSTQFNAGGSLPVIAANKSVQIVNAKPANADNQMRSRTLLQGIILDKEEPYCLIANNIYKLGDTWNGKKISVISREGVTLMGPKGDRTFLENHIKNIK